MHVGRDGRVPLFTFSKGRSGQLFTFSKGRSGQKVPTLHFLKGKEWTEGANSSLSKSEGVGGGFRSSISQREGVDGCFTFPKGNGGTPPI